MTTARLAAMMLFGVWACRAQVPLECGARAVSPGPMRAEGMTELVSDIIITCTGGEPMPAHRLLPQVNLRIATQPVVEITSRVLARANDGGDFTEALLLIDEPAPAKQRPCGSPKYPYSAPSTRQAAEPGVCAAHPGAPDSNGIGTYDPDTPVGVVGHPFAGFAAVSRGNVYQGRRDGRNALVWRGVPFDPPGPRRTRTLRVTNVRVNASELGLGLTSLGMVISTDSAGTSSGPLAGGGITLPLENPAFSMGPVLPGLDFRLLWPRPGLQCRQCESANEDFFSNNARPLTSFGGGAECDWSNLRLRFTERFPGAFRRRTVSLPVGDRQLSLSLIAGPPDRSQDTFAAVPGESGFYKAAPSDNWPAVLESGSRMAGPDAGALGLADHGTRLVAKFTNVPDGIQVWVRNTMQTVIATPCNVQFCEVGRATLTLGSEGPFAFPGSEAAPSGAGGGINRVRISAGAGEAVWEIVNSSPIILESISIPVILAYKANPTANSPPPGIASVAPGFAPSGSVSSIPRFAATGDPETLLTINTCRRNILFPFVTNSVGFDTGLSIANTSKGPFGAAPQTGSCRLGFFGTINGTPAVLRYPSPEIGGGEHIVWSLSAGGAVPATPGFQGYVIAECGFQYANGFAFLHSPETGLAMSYLGLVIGEPVPPFTGARGERLGR